MVVEVGGIQPPPQGSSDPSDASTHARLQRLVGRDHQSLSVLASLLEEHAAAWQDSSAFDALADGAQRDYFQLEDGQVRAWFDGQCKFGDVLCVCPYLLTPWIQYSSEHFRRKNCCYPPRNQICSNIYWRRTHLIKSKIEHGSPCFTV